MFWSTGIALQHPFMFKYQVDEDKYVNFLIPIHQSNKTKVICADLLGFDCDLDLDF